jgi:hypothetical protein
MTKCVSDGASEAKDTITYLQAHGWCPSKLLFDESVVRVAATYTLRTRNMLNRQFFVLKAQHYLCHLIHAYHLITANIQRLLEIRFGQPADGSEHPVTADVILSHKVYKLI